MHAPALVTKSSLSIATDWSRTSKRRFRGGRGELSLQLSTASARMRCGRKICSDFVPDLTGRVALSQRLMAFVNCIIGFLTAISSINKDVFQITSVSPNYLRNESVFEGGTFTMACSVNKYMRSCVWQHREPSINDVILLEIFEISQVYRVAVNGTYMVARSFFLLFLNSSAWPCLAPPQLCYGYHFVHLWGTASERARSVCTFLC